MPLALWTYTGPLRVCVGGCQLWGDISLWSGNRERCGYRSGDSHRILLEFLNLLQGFYFPEIGKRVRMVRRICNLLFGYAWFWQESCGVCSSFIIAGSPDFPQYDEVWLVGTSPRRPCGPPLGLLALGLWARGTLLGNVSPRSTALFP